MIKVLGIDPGTEHLGAGVLELNTKEKKSFKLIYADSFKGDLTNYDIRDDTPHQTKAKGLIRSYSYLLELFDPSCVSCEDNFFKFSQAAFKRLIEVVTMMSFCTLTEKPEVPFHLHLPRITKQIIDADKDGGDKNLVKSGLLKCPFLDLNGFNLDNLTEHAIDAILLALYECVQIYKSYGWEFECLKKNKK